MWPCQRWKTFQITSPATHTEHTRARKQQQHIAHDSGGWKAEIRKKRGSLVMRAISWAADSPHVLSGSGRRWKSHSQDSTLWPKNVLLTTPRSTHSNREGIQPGDTQKDPLMACVEASSALLKNLRLRQDVWREAGSDLRAGFICKRHNMHVSLPNKLKKNVLKEQKGTRDVPQLVECWFSMHRFPGLYKLGVVMYDCSPGTRRWTQKGQIKAILHYLGSWETAWTTL